MKKFWNLMFAALVAMGAVACTEDDNSVNTGGDDTVSFEAVVANYDAETEGANELWQGVWTGKETITITYNETTYAFTNSEQEKSRFTCTTEGVAAIVGKSVALKLENKELSTKGSTAIAVDMTIEKFDPSKSVELEASNAFIKYAIEGEAKVTFEMNYPAFVYNSGKNSSISIKDVTGTNYVAFIPGTKTEAELKVLVEGTLVDTKALQLKAGAIYDLGTLTIPENGGNEGGEDNPTETTTVYFVPGIWDVDDAWFAAYFFNSAGDSGSLALVKDSEGVCECAVPAGMENIIFCRMNPAYTEFDWNNESVNDRVWNQTADLEIGIAPNNYYYIHDWEVGMWGTKDGYDKPAPKAPWAIAGSFNNWDNLPMEFTDTENLYVARDLTLAEDTEFKIKDVNTWDVSFGYSEPIEADHFVILNNTAGQDNNIRVATMGTYDLYFEYVDGGNCKLYVMTAGGDYTTAVEQTAGTGGGGNTPGGGESSGEASEWALVGDFAQSGGSWSEIQMYSTETAGIFIAEDVTIPVDYFSFLIKKFGDNTWNPKYGAGDITYFNPGNWMPVVDQGGDISLTKAGLYDFYFDATNIRLYVVDAGADYTTVPEQTENGKEPMQQEPDVTDNVVYLKPNSNWMEDNARFAAYFWNNSGNVWVSMVDSDSDGIYEVNLPVGYSYGCNIIFCRMNPATTANNWNNKWNQTNDLTTPTDGNNLYTVADGAWDKGDGTWSKK
ncbi:MAG: hypothetical protein IJB56_00625 [Alistipes sp.]|nr:hypothetical protein [Alistipes sp.]